MPTEPRARYWLLQGEKRSWGNRAGQLCWVYTLKHSHMPSHGQPFSLSQTQTHTSCAYTLSCTWAHTVNETTVLLLVNVTFTSIRRSVSEGMSLLTFTRCLQKELAASSVSALYQGAVRWIWKITAPPLRRCDRSSSAIGVMVPTWSFWMVVMIYPHTQLE